MNNIIELFTRDTGLYSRFLQFETIAFIIFLLFILTFFFKRNYGFIVLLVAFVLYITNIYVGIRRSNLNDFNKETLMYLNDIKSVIRHIIRDTLIFYGNSNNLSLPKTDVERIIQNNNLEYFHIDANMIHFIHSFLPLYKYSHRGFYLFVKGVNNILKIRSQIEDYHQANGEYPHNIAEMFEIALELKRHTINNLHNFIYSVPKNKEMYKYVNDITERYNVLISRNLDIIHNYYIKDIQKRGITTSTKIVTYNTTKPYDRYNNYSIINHKAGTASSDQHAVDTGDLLPFYY